MKLIKYCAYTVIAGLTFIAPARAASQNDGVDSSLLPDDQCKRLYSIAWESKSRASDAVDYAFVEGVPVVARVRTVAPREQCVASLILHAIRRNANAVSTSIIRDARKIKADNPDVYAAVSDARYFEKLSERPRKRKRARMEQDSDASDLRPSQLPEDHAHPHGSERWQNIQSLVPDVELLGEKAGYVDIHEEATPGIAMCLLMHSLSGEAPVPAVIDNLLEERMLKSSVRYDEPMPWSQVASLLRRDIPLIMMTPDGRPFLVLGFMEAANEGRILFGFDPDRVERGVLFGGRRMPESRLAEFRQTNPQPDFIKPRYYDFVSSHKQYQLPGFVAARFDDSMTWVVLEDVQPDLEAIRAHTIEVFDEIIKEDSQVREEDK